MSKWFKEYGSGVIISIVMLGLLMGLIYESEKMQDQKEKYAQQVTVDISDELKQYDKLVKERDELKWDLAITDSEIHSLKGEHRFNEENLKAKYESKIKKLESEHKESLDTMTRIINAEGSGLLPEDKDIQDVCKLYAKKLNIYCEVYHEEN